MLTSEIIENSLAYSWPLSYINKYILAPLKCFNKSDDVQMIIARENNKLYFYYTDKKYKVIKIESCDDHGNDFNFMVSGDDLANLVNLVKLYKKENRLIFYFHDNKLYIRSLKENSLLTIDNFNSNINLDSIKKVIESNNELLDVNSLVINYDLIKNLNSLLLDDYDKTIINIYKKYFYSLEIVNKSISYFIFLAPYKQD